MFKHQKSSNANFAAQRISVRLLLRSAIAGSIVAGFVCPAAAQSGLVLPSFPDESAVSLLPVSQATTFPVALAESIPAYPSTAKRVAILLGFKKQSPTPALSQSVPALAIPAFPSTSPMQLTTQFVPEQASSTSHTPTIFRSTSGKVRSLPVEYASNPTVLASADESLPEVDVPAIVTVQTALAMDEPIEESLNGLSSETLTDVEIPHTPVQEVQQRLPELVRRSPAMQLHFGGNLPSSSTLADSEKTESTSNKFSLSDSSEIAVDESKVQKPSPRIMNVRIEGEPVPVQDRSDRPIVPSATATSIQKKASFDLSSSVAGHKALSDKSNDLPPAIGPRLEVDLHESVNVETTQPISGLSVEHPDLCQVLKSGERSVSFVGLKAGQTRVALFTTNASGERKIEIREVVIAGAESRQADMKSLAVEMGKSVRRMYPNSRIEVIAESEALTVQGYASSEAEAKKIIGLVRRTSLQPVVDRLATYK